ncbi:3D-(3,5/4)-trihydroxycyclohexane-1,2-dione acylhydrolase (decyclizing) [Parasphaerochaeta coccoides]|uniref:3D-(3,5/4)-trihydroxycyclohexane-1,2-dione hydrolase n=1 Tax=Parasphaerochaeta coccoides (strain ATCC BAA-1237 / DSM 17374 / SPN1) TaxID=760011 RepID=F4GJ31_PARC1|nr:3D-(3,5/4)-trihydroxycyclohexane-1,2-dione acylhydrolase (decyclizing) [Parasphaerochaeta coccoides]AEC01326.1 3D-(3,5/4)-trihydroxycyclohexane-1,2-dione hydrolase [Parasphaerochaeta coccoides DSM 17374]
MAKIRLTMAQALLRFLDNQYVDFDGQTTKFVTGVFGIFGHGSVVGLGEALAAESNKLPFYQAKNEQGAVHAATAYAKENNRLKIMAVVSSIGPGALNMVTGAGTATANHLPVLLLPGDVFACRQPDPVLQQIEIPYDYTITANDAFRAVSRYWDRINRPEQVMSAMLNAMRVLTDPAETGAVTIALPQDVQGEAYDYPQEFFEKRIHHIERRMPTEAQIKRAADAIRKSRKPLVICGGGVRYSSAGDVLREFCHKFHVPFGETQSGKGVIPWDDAYNLSGIGTTGSLAANRIAADADLVIGIGTRLGDFTTCSKWLFKNPDCTFLSVNVSGFDAYKMNSEPIVSDAKAFLEALLRDSSLGAYETAWGKEVPDIKGQWDKEVCRLYSEEVSGGLSQARVIGELNDRLLPHDAVVISGSGSVPSDMQRVWRTRVTGTYHVEYAFSCMGYEIAAALGAKIAHPDREVVVIIGDGAYAMLHSELLTAVQEGKKIIVFVLDNAGFQCIDNLQHSQGIVHYGNEWKVREESTGRLTGASLAVDYAKNAESWGAVGLRADTIQELEDATRRALKETRPTVVHVHVTPKSMTGNYEAWWRVGIAEVSENPDVVTAWERMQDEIEKTRKF